MEWRAAGACRRRPARGPGPRPTGSARPCSRGSSTSTSCPAARVLDLYAGSGALGLEAASRGARSVLLVDADRNAAKVARGNAAVVGLPGVVVREDTVERVLLAGPGGRGRVDLVFLDPPYDLSEDALGDALALLVGHGWLAPEALVVVERSSRSPEPRWSEGLAPRGGASLRRDPDVVRRRPRPRRGGLTRRIPARGGEGHDLTPRCGLLWGGGASGPRSDAEMRLLVGPGGERARRRGGTGRRRW